MSETHSASNRQRLRVLIGENNADLSMTLGLLLETEPDMACVAQVTSSREVLRSASELSPDAFVLDLSLDDGSSLPLISTLRARLPSAAIVVFTGHSNLLLTEQCLGAGANAVVVKSGEIEALTGALRQAARELGTGRDAACQGEAAPGSG